MAYNFIISFSSKYQSLISIFMQLFLRNTNNIEKKIYVSLDQEVPLDFKYDDIYISKDETLPAKIKRIAEKHPEDFYICLLGDAFITNISDVDGIFNELTSCGFRYCNLMPKGTNKLKNKTNIKKIKTKIRYGVSFIAFAATYDFVIKEFDNISDYEFEIKYLKEGIETKDRYFDGMYILTGDFFGIVHGVSNGKWNRKAYSKISKENIVISNEIPKQTIGEYLRDCLARFSSFLVPLRARHFLKGLLIKMGFSFKSDY